MKHWERPLRHKPAVPVYCQAKGGLYWVGNAGGEVNIEWISKYTGIDPDNVKQIERQSKRWFITLVHP